MTKNACKLNAREEVDYMISDKNKSFSDEEKVIIIKNCYPILRKLKL